MKSFFLASTFLAASAFVANAATVTVTSVSGVWSSGVQTNGNAPTGIGTSSISWGIPVTPRLYSGYTFAATGVPFSPVAESTFTFGTLTHNNFPIYAPSLSSAVLDLTVAVDIGGTSQNLTAQYLFSHNETTNTAGTCPAGSVTVCDDIVSFSPIYSSFDTINVDGVEYTFVLDNFVNSDGVSVSNFLTAEGQANTAQLVGRFTSEIPLPAVPVPAAFPLLVGAIGALGFVARRKRAA